MAWLYIVVAIIGAIVGVGLSVSDVNKAVKEEREKWINAMNIQSISFEKEMDKQMQIFEFEMNEQRYNLTKKGGN